jgi:hypothetical protein
MEQIDIESLTDHLRSSLIEILIILYTKGIDQVPVCPALRLLGLDPTEAQAFDNMQLLLNDKFEQYVFGLNSDLMPIQQVPKNQILH